MLDAIREHRLDQMMKYELIITLNFSAWMQEHVRFDSNYIQT